VHIEGKSTIGEGCEIHQGSHISNSRLGNRVIRQRSLRDSRFRNRDDCAVGPFAHLRMNAHMEERAVVGNFVEVRSHASVAAQSHAI